MTDSLVPSLAGRVGTTVCRLDPGTLQRYVAEHERDCDRPRPPDGEPEPGRLGPFGPGSEKRRHPECEPLCPEADDFAGAADGGEPPPAVILQRQALIVGAGDA